MKKFLFFLFVISNFIFAATPQEIKEEFDSNAARAKHKYKNQTVTIEFTISKIQDGLFGNSLNVFDNSGNIMLVIPEDKYNDSVYNLDAGQTIKVEVKPVEMSFGIVTVDFIKFVD